MAAFLVSLVEGGAGMVEGVKKGEVGSTCMYSHGIAGRLVGG